MESRHEDYLREDQIYMIESWNEFQKITAEEKYRRWAFRGQGRSDWPLDTTLSRHLTQRNIHKTVWAHQEERIIRIFCRKAQQFLHHIPREDDIFGWLAIMQHHGAPTRLLDFTWSPFVAAFFALESATADCAVWAVNFTRLREMEYQFPFEQKPRKAPRPDMPLGFSERKEQETSLNLTNYWRYFLNNSIPFVAQGEPWNMNQRQIAQSGTFLIPGILHKPIEGILHDHVDPASVIVKFNLRTEKLRSEAMESLYYMNITNSTLFPGIDGMARSLIYELEFHWAFDPRTLEAYQAYLGSLDFSEIDDEH